MGAEMDHKEPGFELKWLKMGRNGSFSLVRLGLELRGFKACYLHLVSALGCLDLGGADMGGLGVTCARSCVMQCTLPTQGMRSIISMVSISPEGFLPSILLLVVTVVIVAVVMVTVILVVVVVAIVGVVIVVAIIGVFVIVMIIRVVVVVVGGVPYIIKLSFVIIGFLRRIFGAILIGQEPFQFGPGDPVGLFNSDRLGVCIPPGQGIVG
ncbi:hypothetical protein Tco_0623331 [Tanacetum coccineum]